MMSLCFYDNVFPFKFRHWKTCLIVLTLRTSPVLLKVRGHEFWHILVLQFSNLIWEKIKFCQLMSLKILRGFGWKDEFVRERVWDYIIAKDVIHSRLPPTPTPDMLVRMLTHVHEHFRSWRQPRIFPKIACLSSQKMSSGCCVCRRMYVDGMHALTISSSKSSLTFVFTFIICPKTIIFTAWRP